MSSSTAQEVRHQLRHNLYANFGGRIQTMITELETILLQETLETLELKTRVNELKQLVDLTRHMHEQALLVDTMTPAELTGFMKTALNNVIRIRRDLPAATRPLIDLLSNPPYKTHPLISRGRFARRLEIYSTDTIVLSSVQEGLQQLIHND